MKLALAAVLLVLGMSVAREDVQRAKGGGARPEIQSGIRVASGRADGNERRGPGWPKAAAGRSHTWATAHVTSYSGNEPGVSSYTACAPPFHRLVDDNYTVAVNPRLGWTRAWCGRYVYVACAKSRVCWRGYHRFRITDTTACTRSFCDFELSYSASRLMGAPEQYGSLTWTGYIHYRWTRP